VDHRASEEESVDAARAFAELGRDSVTECSLQVMLQKIAVLTRRTIAAAAGASLTVVAHDQAIAVAHAGLTGLDLDEGHYRSGSGPCLDAARGGKVVLVSDLATDRRWPAYTRQAAGRGVRSCLSVPLPIQQLYLGGLNVYATRPAAFDAQATGLALAFAGYAALAVTNNSRDAVTPLAGGERTGRKRWAVIEQATGVLVARRGCSPEHAFGYLVGMAQDTGRTLAEIATRIVRGHAR
jgi:GAF domain-containing protein